ncbi:alpha/beta fold hydrolase [Nocardioides aestuarii]|uniref:Alpha/beta hydrolase family protein n=1 Tax=Nocardioides aestuarii TaxID=252231 RepID=A0ABW4TKB7_9ACTN
MQTRLAVAVVLATLVVGGCSAQPDPRPEPDAAPTSESASESGESPEPSAEPSREAREDRLPKVTGRLSLPTLMREQPSGGRPRITSTEYETDAYTRHRVLYRSGDVDVSGVLLVPKGRGPFPAIVLNHGYIDPAYYVTGQGLAREQDALARAGYVVLHTDYRGHAASDPVFPLERETRIAYTRDAINAVPALRKLPYVDDDRLAMLGRSMGGGVTMNAIVAQPDLVDAAVIYASVSSRLDENVEHFTEPNRPEEARSVYDTLGTPREERAVWRGLSARSYFDRIEVPVLSHHGRVDATCPPRWATETQQAMRAAGVDSTLAWYPGEDHAFYALWQQSMNRTIAFLDRELRV